MSYTPVIEYLRAFLGPRLRLAALRCETASWAHRVLAAIANDTAVDFQHRELGHDFGRIQAGSVDDEFGAQRGRFDRRHDLLAHRREGWQDELFGGRLDTQFLQHLAWVVHEGCAVANQAVRTREVGVVDV